MVVSGRLLSLHLVIVLSIGLGVTGCSKKRSDAIVTAKEHIDAAEVKASPTATPSMDDVKDRPADTPVEGVTIREMAPDEIAVDGFVMKKEVRGTSKDPRAKNEEQWRLEIQIVALGHSKTIQTDRAHYDKLKVGDRIKVAYYQGKYTGTVWTADIED
jgi:co-chaperonin GroES (HSP10)